MTVEIMTYFPVLATVKHLRGLQVRSRWGDTAGATTEMLRHLHGPTRQEIEGLTHARREVERQLSNLVEFVAKGDSSSPRLREEIRAREQRLAELDPRRRGGRAPTIGGRRQILPRTGFPPDLELGHRYRVIVGTNFGVNPLGTSSFLCAEQQTREEAPLQGLLANSMHTSVQASLPSLL